MIQLKSCEGYLSAGCGKIVRQAQAALYLVDKALSRTRVNWLHLYTERKKLVMKTYRSAAVASVLTLVLATSIFAGEIHTDGAPTPQPTPAASSIAETATTGGEMHTDGAASAVKAADAMTAAALNLLQSVFTLL
jgi:hypothetical protein